jgi:TonB family protein
MKYIISFIFLLVFSIMPVSESFAQKGKDKVVMPQFPGGEAELHKFIISELQYPIEARVNKESGEVMVAFSVGMDGYISGVRVVRSVSESLDAEAVRVVGKMPSWIPGKKNGRPVRAEMTIPINFRVNYENKFIDDAEDREKAQKARFRY